jgi:thioredoxin-dependent peroxiredoxin
MSAGSKLLVGMVFASWATTYAYGGTVKTDMRAVRVTMKGNPVVLAGVPVGEGEAAPDFRVVDAAFQPVRLSDFRGKIVLVSAVTSLDTGVCSTQTRKFNEEAANLPSNVVVLAISADLPFAQKRFCEAERVGRIKVLSDSVWRDFGSKFGILIKDMGLLARSVWVIGPDGKVGYREIVPEISTEPDYAAALRAAREMATKRE